MPKYRHKKSRSKAEPYNSLPNAPGGPKAQTIPPFVTSRKRAMPATSTHGIVTAPHLHAQAYSKADNYAGMDKEGTIFYNVPPYMSNPDLMYWNPQANTGSLDPWQETCQFKFAVPQNEILWAKNPWFFANGEAREYFGGELTAGDISGQLSLNEDGTKVHERLGTNTDYKHTSKSYVDRFFA